MEGVTMKIILIATLIVMAFSNTVRADDLCIAVMEASKGILEESMRFKQSSMHKATRETLVKSAKYSEALINSYEQILNNCELTKAERNQIDGMIDGKKKSLEEARILIWSGLYK